MSTRSHNDPRNAFLSPTVATKVRLGNRISPRNSSASNDSGGNRRASRTSRKNSSPEDAEIMQQLSGSTAVRLSNSDDMQRRDHTPIMTQLSDGAMQLMQSFSPTEGESMGQSRSMEDDSTIPTDLDLGHNDNSFHVLASLLVEFFSDRYTSSTIVLLPEDRFALDRLLPSTAVHPFIEAVQYRLGHTPAVPTTPIQCLALECQKLGLDRNDASLNPILVAATLDSEPKTVHVLAVDDATGRVLLQQDDEDEDVYVMDMQPPSSSSSSSPSVIHVASSQEVAEEMHQQACDEQAAILDRVDPVLTAGPLELLSDDDSMPTGHYDDDEVVVEDPAVIQEGEVAALPEHHHMEPSVGMKRAVEELHSQPSDNKKSFVQPPSQHLGAPDDVPQAPVSQQPEMAQTVSSQQVEMHSQPSDNKKSFVQPSSQHLGAPDDVPQAPVSQQPEMAQTVSSQQVENTHPDFDAAASAAASADTTSIIGQFQTSTGNFLQGFFTGPSSTEVAKTPPSIPPPEDTTAQNTSAAVAAPSTKDTVDQSINTNRAVVPNVASKEENTSPVVPVHPNPPMNPFLMNFASFMDRSPAPVRPPIRNDSFGTTNNRLHASAVPQKDPTKTANRSSVGLQSLPAQQPSIRSDQTAREQLEDELAEAEKMLGMSVTPETTNFWRNHRDLLASRLATMGPMTTMSQEPIAPAPSSGSGNNNYLGDSTRALPDTIQAATIGEAPNNNDGGSKTFSEMTPTPPITENMQQPNHLASTGTGSITNKEALPMVDVVAPADLPGGYQFEAEIEGKRFLAIVPSGGVQQGETFTCFMRELDSVAVDIPVGYWKDGLYDMCRLGCCHPVLWHSFMCPLIALGQIQTRIDLDFLGRPRFGTTTVSNRFMMLTMAFFWVFTNIGLFIACNLKWSHGMELSVADICAFLLMNGTMLAFLVFVTQSTRNSLREKFMIREERCLDLEDLCCALACLPCTVGQMARHTANYEEYEAVCCSHTGLPDGVCVNQSEESTAPYKNDGYVV